VGPPEENEWMRSDLQPAAPPPEPKAADPEMPPGILPPAPSSAAAPAPPPAFGARGGIVIRASAGAAITSTGYASSEASALRAVLAPGVDYFLLRNFSVGLTTNISYYRSRGYVADRSLVTTTSTTFAGGPRLGFNVPLGRLVSFYPTLALGIEWFRRSERGAASTASNALGVPTTTRAGPWLELSTPMLLHPSEHVFFGIGPYVFREFGRAGGGPEIGGGRTGYGMQVFAGIHWGESGESAPSSPEPRDRSAFGEKATVLVSGGANLSATEYDGTSASSASLGIGAGVDYFFANHISVGASAAGGYGKTKGFETNGTKTTAESSGFSVGPRLGTDLPFTSVVSLYLRMGATFGKHDVVLKSADKRVREDPFIVTFVIDALLLVHVASHAFLGIGPFLAHDLVREATSGSFPATSGGLGTVVGTWF
jgi:hypothetical protein